jgi:ligand-binding SRPBCC domain-containing protein
MIITTEIEIAAPPEVCFDLARDMNAHAASTASTKERIVECPEGGMLELGDEVEFEANHFGVRQRLRSKIVEYDRPRRFVDQMQKGAFARLKHVHEFRPTATGTTMVDTLDFASPLGPLGAIADSLFLKAYMRKFLVARNMELKAMAEKQAS